MTIYEVSREALRYNIRQLKKRAGRVPVWAVIKGDGYGLGVLPLAKVLSEEGIDRFCFTELREAELLRENGFVNEKILMLRQVSDAETLKCLVKQRAILTVGSQAAAEMAERVAAEMGELAQIHLKIDTGMGRFGFLPREIDKVPGICAAMGHLRVAGVYTHFNCAFQNDGLTQKEFTSFMNTVEKLREAGMETGEIHCCNSAAFLKHPEMHCDGVRLGSALLGRMAFPTELRPVGVVRTQIDEVRTLSKGDTTGYGALWTAKRDTRVAILPVGWYHGFHVSCQPDLSRRGDCLRTILSDVKRVLRPQRVWVKIAGKDCPVVGTIGMLHCAVDVNGLDCAPGDWAELKLNPLHRNGIPVVFR